MAAGPQFPSVKTNRGPAPAGKGPAVTTGSVAAIAGTPVAVPSYGSQGFPSVRTSPKSS